MSAKAILSASVSAAPVYVEDVFSTFLYTGNSSTQTITNNIDVTGKGALVWLKNRTAANSHFLFDTVRGVGTGTQALSSNSSAGGGAGADIAFTSTGFNLTQAGSNTNASSNNYASWTFRKQPKFFDIVTYTGNGAGQGVRAIAHGLTSTPGCIIIKRTDASSEWAVWHRYAGVTNQDLSGISLNGTGAAIGYPNGTTALMNSASFDPANIYGVTATASNINNATYVAYLFAHDAGGFGLAGADNVVSCGSFNTDGSSTATVSLGYEPQWLLMKRTDSSSGGNWFLLDVMRGWSQKQSFLLHPNNSDAEVTYSNNPSYITPTSTGFQLNTGLFQPSATYIYIAIRRGPMKTPTVGTSVFLANNGAGSTSGQTIATTFPVDLAMSAYRTSAYVGTANDRLRGIGNTNTAGATPALQTSTTDAESAFSATNPWFINAWNNSITRGSNGADPSGGIVTWLFGRAPSFFDEVCYTGDGVAGRAITHNLGVTPEWMIVKRRTTNDGAGYWASYSATTGNTQSTQFGTAAAALTNSTFWNNTAPTSTNFTVGTITRVNGSGETYVAYLFATCAGVSKCGSYTGTGTTQTINCGFTAGARFVMIKRTDSTGDWYVWDSARGIVAGNDPYLLLNSTAAEVTGTDYIDPLSSGFEISSTAPAAINANGGNFIFLAIA